MFSQWHYVAALTISAHSNTTMDTHTHTRIVWAIAGIISLIFFFSLPLFFCSFSCNLSIHVVFFTLFCVWVACNAKFYFTFLPYFPREPFKCWRNCYLVPKFKACKVATCLSTHFTFLQGWFALYGRKDGRTIDAKRNVRKFMPIKY